MFQIRAHFTQASPGLITLNAKPESERLGDTNWPELLGTGIGHELHLRGTQDVSEARRAWAG